MVFMRLVQLMPATSGTGSGSGQIAIKGGSLGMVSLQEEVQEAEQQGWGKGAMASDSNSGKEACGSA